MVVRATAIGQFARGRSSSGCAKARPKTHLVTDYEEVVLEGQTGEAFHFLARTQKRHATSAGYQHAVGQYLTAASSLFLLDLFAYARCPASVFRVPSNAPAWRKAIRYSIARASPGARCGWAFDAALSSPRVQPHSPRAGDTHHRRPYGEGGCFMRDGPFPFLGFRKAMFPSFLPSEARCKQLPSPTLTST